MKYLDLLIWILFSLTDGYRDGGAFSWTNKLYPPGWDVHHYFLPDRAMKLLFTLTFTWQAGTDWCLLPGLAVAYMLIFSWFHNGMMHCVRGRQDVPGRGWRSWSDTTTAKISFGYWERSFYLVVGIFIYGFLRFIELRQEPFV